MAARFCVECGRPVSTEFCPNCGAAQPGTATDQPTTAIPVDPPTTALPPAVGADEQPWHPFEQPSWYPEYADPRVESTDRDPRWTPGTPTDLGPDFMGVSQWQTEPPPPPPHRNRGWLLGSLAAVAVVVLLGVVAFLVIRGQGNNSATPDATNPPATTAANTTTVATSEPTTAAEAPATVTTTEITTASEPAAGTATDPTTSAGSTAPASSEIVPTSADPLGAPTRDIICAPAYVVQIASGVDEASFVARVSELRAAGQLPADAAVARTATSCSIFAGQTNSIVLYAGPFTDPYAGCEARLAGAPDSFIKGTTPETAQEYVSCLCPAQVITVPTILSVGQSGVWVGELQRILANKLNIPIPDLGGTWGTFSQSTSDAVRKFQAENNLPATGQVSADTWQALQTAEC